MPETPENTPASTAVSVHLTLRVGDQSREFDAVAATDADGFKVVDGLLTALRDDARSWAQERQS
jgi:hypothetical protein